MVGFILSKQIFCFEINMKKPELKIFLAAPRGFCAGVDRAIQIVEMAIDKWGAPVYVRHEIVHNKFVVDSLKDKGAIFVEELDECPNDRPVIFSAHGVPKAVPSAAEARNLVFVDATCPLVSKVHIEAERHHKNGLQILIPPNHANGHLCLSKECLFHYKLSYKGSYVDQKKQFSLKWNDPKLKINWGIKKPILSNRDKKTKILK